MPAIFSKSWGNVSTADRRDAVLPQPFVNGNGRKSLAGQGQALPNVGRPAILSNGLGKTVLTGAGSIVLPKPPPGQTVLARPPAGGVEKKGAAGQRRANPNFVDAPPSLEVWEKATGARALLTQIRNFTPQEMVQFAGDNQSILKATVVPGDQAPKGSQEQNFADFVMRSVKQGILESLPVAMAELNSFSRKSEFQGRQLEWVKFLAGETINVDDTANKATGEKFPYASCQAFWDDSDTNLESKHDYVQIVFPSWGPSSNCNRDLYIRDNVETWKALLRECPTVKRNIHLNIQLNAIRMLHFWGFRFAFTQDAPNPIWNVDRVFVILEDNLSSPLHRDGDHNALRATRFIEALKMFGCFNGLLKIFAEGLLPEYYSKHHVYKKYWTKAWENTTRLF
jgi:hypothetical protein